MAVSAMDIIENLNKEDQDKVSYFVRLLLNQSKYQAFKKEIGLRREEIQQGKTLTHEEIWDQMNV